MWKCQKCSILFGDDLELLAFCQLFLWLTKRAFSLFLLHREADWLCFTWFQSVEKSKIYNYFLLWFFQMKVIVEHHDSVVMDTSVSRNHFASCSHQSPGIPSLYNSWNASQLHKVVIFHFLNLWIFRTAKLRLRSILSWFFSRKQRTPRRGIFWECNSLIQNRW